MNHLVFGTNLLDPSQDLLHSVGVLLGQHVNLLQVNCTIVSLSVKLSLGPEVLFQVHTISLQHDGKTKHACGCTYTRVCNVKSLTLICMGNNN